MKRNLNWQKTFFWVMTYSIGMAFLESAVVIYLREICCPFGFEFPLTPMDKHIASTELGREAGTILMLLAVAFLAGRSDLQRFAYFILSFAIWDVFYYIFLKVFLDWPESLLTWDILFLVPTVWTGPVIAPLLVSLLMILLAVFIIRREGRKYVVIISAASWLILISGSLVLMLVFMWDYSAFILHHHSLTSLWNWSGNAALGSEIYRYIPRQFNWFLFLVSQLILLSGITNIIRQSWKADKIK
jgi:hypothetical protein